MSRVGVRSLSPSSCSASAPSLPKLLALSLGAARDLVEGVAAVAAPLLSGLPGAKAPFGRPDACCAVPEQDCPPRCVCEITWEAARGEKLRCTVRLVNTSASTRTFTVTSTGFTGPEGGFDGPQVLPAQLQLDGGSTGLVDVSFLVGEKMPDGEYVAEVVVRGAYEQCVTVLLTVTSRPCRPGCDTCRCEVRQGDPPVRVRAHHWYDHFQCTDPCAPPRTQDRGREPVG